MLCRGSLCTVISMSKYEQYLEKEFDREELALRRIERSAKKRRKPAEEDPNPFSPGDRYLPASYPGKDTLPFG